MLDGFDNLVCCLLFPSLLLFVFRSTSFWECSFTDGWHFGYFSGISLERCYVLEHELLFLFWFDDDGYEAFFPFVLPFMILALHGLVLGSGWFGDGFFFSVLQAMWMALIPFWCSDPRPRPRPLFSPLLFSSPILLLHLLFSVLFPFIHSLYPLPKNGPKSR